MLIENLFYYLKNYKNYYYEYYIIYYKSSRLIRLNKNFLNFSLAVYNGKFFIPLIIKENMNQTLLKSFVFSKGIRLQGNNNTFKKKKKK